MRLRTVLTWVVVLGIGGILLYLTALPGDLPADLDDGSGLAGVYTVNGVDPLEVEYSGTVTIAATTDPDRYDVEWIVTGGIQRGIGELDGRTFTVVWQSTASGGGTGTGTAEYALEDDGRLVGTKSVDGFDRIGTEEIFPNAQDDASNR